MTSPFAGGAIADDHRYSLSDISLRWMVKQVILSQCGVLFDQAALRRADIDITNVAIIDPRQPTVGDYWRNGPRNPKHPSPVPSHEDADDGDEARTWPTDEGVLADCHDQLKSQKAWWILEMFPIKYAWQDFQGKWHAKWG